MASSGHDEKAEDELEKRFSSHTSQWGSEKVLPFVDRISKIGFLWPQVTFFLKRFFFFLMDHVERE